MKKALLFTIGLLLIAAVLAGCGSNSTSGTAENNNDSTTTSQGNSQGGQSQLSPCQQNLLAIDSAALDYKIKNSGQHPATVDVLVPNYLKTLPVEPFGGTYTLVEDTGHGDNVKAVCSQGHTY